MDYRPFCSGLEPFSSLNKIACCYTAPATCSVLGTVSPGHDVTTCPHSTDLLPYCLAGYRYRKCDLPTRRPHKFTMRVMSRILPVPPVTAPIPCRCAVLAFVSLHNSLVLTRRIYVVPHSGRHYHGKIHYLPAPFHCCREPRATAYLPSLLSGLGRHTVLLIPATRYTNRRTPFLLRATPITNRMTLRPFTVGTPAGPHSGDLICMSVFDRPLAHHAVCPIDRLRCYCRLPLVVIPLHCRLFAILTSGPFHSYIPYRTLTPLTDTPHAVFCRCLYALSPAIPSWLPALP